MGSWGGWGHQIRNSDHKSGSAVTPPTSAAWSPRLLAEAVSAQMHGPCKVHAGWQDCDAMRK